MRITSDKGYEISSIDIGKTLPQVRENLSKIDPFDADIIVIATQPGTGKSTLTRIYCKNNPKLKRCVLTKRHDLLDEYHEIPDINHWQGWPKLCQRQDDKIFKKLDMYKIDSKYCKILGCGDCNYPKQFEDKKMVLAPNNYIYLYYVHGFDIIFVDEQMLETQKIIFDHKYLCSISGHIKFRGLRHHLLKKDIPWLEEHKGKINSLLQFRINQAIEEPNEKKWPLISILLKFNMDEIIQSLKIEKKYNKDSSKHILTWHKPYLYYLFELAEKTKIVITCATFNQEFFIDMLKSYSGEFGFKRPLKIKVLKSNIQNKNTYVFKAGSGHYPNKIPESHMNYLNPLLEEVGSGNIGIITNKKFTANKGKIERFMDTDIDSMHFGASTGKNTLEDKTFLFITGTYYNDVTDTLKKYNALYNDNLKIEDVKMMKQSYNIKDDSTPNRVNKFIHPKFSVIDSIINDSELYDAFHRNRGLLKNKVIITCSYIPDDIKIEFDAEDDYQKYDLTNSPNWNDFTKDLNIEKYNNVPMDNMESMMELMVSLPKDISQGLTDSEIARKHHLYSDSRCKKLNVDLVKGFRFFNKI